MLVLDATWDFLKTRGTAGSHNGLSRSAHPGQLMTFGVSNAPEGAKAGASGPSAPSPSSCRSSTPAPAVRAGLAEGPGPGPGLSELDADLAAEIAEYAVFLGIDPERDPELLWIAQQAYFAPLPPPWTEHTDPQGNVYFYNPASEESTWAHPLEETYRALAAKWLEEKYLATTRASNSPPTAFFQQPRNPVGFSSALRRPCCNAGQQDPCQGLRPSWCKGGCGRRGAGAAARKRRRAAR